MSNKEAELNNAILLYICECQVSGDFMALRALDISNDILEKLRTMTIQEVLHTAQIRASFIKSIEIDSAILSNLFKRASSEKKSQYILDQLVQRGAPLKLVQNLEGITAMEFSTLRKMQNIEFRGRTQLPTMDEEEAIFKACEALDINACYPQGITGEQWLELSKKTDLTIRLIYKVICESEEPACEQIN